MPLEQVAHHLQLEANRRRANADGDLFARTAYNRYYYAVFLCARNLLTTLNTDWSNMAHASYPGVLKGAVKDDIDRGKQKAKKIKDYDLTNLCSRATNALFELAEIMSKGNATRIVADYHPEIQIDFLSSARFQLNNIDITEAHQWPDKARLLISIIQEAWNQTHV